ncbi:MAG: hypothetical protein M0P76_07105 [Candidatus Pacebacteria bacterium]|nr:hypothetical protein [Candidatus Paceibacterota bacterium]
MRPVKLCFADKKSAKSFLMLVNTYEDDSGAGNGYSAYWPNYDKRKIWLSWKPDNSVMEIDSEFVEHMLCRIYLAHSADFPEEMKEKFSVTHTNKGIVFSMEKLPPRIRPTVGDMYRIPRSLSFDGMGSEGKVIEDKGHTLSVVPCWYWGREGFRSDFEVLKIDESQVMKIHDWLKDLYPERKSWDFDPTIICGKS